MRRCDDVTPNALESFHCPVLIPIHALDTTIKTNKVQTHYRARFTPRQLMPTAKITASFPGRPHAITGDATMQESFFSDTVRQSEGGVLGKPKAGLNTRFAYWPPGSMGGT